MSGARQVEALTHGAGLLERGRWRLVSVGGRDRVDFLHRMLSQDVKAIPVGGAAYACVLDVQGRVLGDPLVWNTGDALLLDFHQGAASSSVPHLEHHVITDDVSFENVSRASRRFALAGPRVPDVMAALGLELPEPGRWLSVERDAWQARVLRADVGTRPACEWIVSPAEASDRFVEDLLGASATRVRPGSWDVLRVEERVPAWAAEITPEVMALEPRLDEHAVSFTKGCYPGQEPVSKAHYRGRPAKLLVRLDLSGPALPGRALLDGGARVGRLTTAVMDPRDGRATALGFVRCAFAEPDTVLDMADGGAARVVEPGPRLP